MSSSSSPPCHLFIIFTLLKLLYTLASSSHYPAGNFGGKQLLDCSRGLSPLYSTQTSDLHVSIVTRTSTSVSTGFNQFKYRSQSFGSQVNNCLPFLGVFLSLCQVCLVILFSLMTTHDAVKATVIKPDSLVRVTRRVYYYHLYVRV